MSVHGVGAAAAHRPQFAHNAQRGSRPAGPQSADQGTGSASVGPTSAHDHSPPAHGVRRLLAEGHFNNSGAYGPLVAKFGLPPEPAAASTDEVALVEGGEDAPATEPTETDGLVIDASGTALDGTPPAPEAEGASEPGLDEILLDEPAPDESTTTESGLLDIDSLLMEELVNEQTVIEEIVEQIDETSDEKPVTDDTTDVAV